MRKHLTHIGIAVLVGAVAVSCSRPGKNRSDDGRYATEGGRHNGSAEQYVKLDGCLQEGSSANGEFALHEVQVLPPSEQPIGQETMERSPIPAGSWVRLVGDASDLKGNLGKRVEVTGRVEDTGANTLGTSGKGASPDASANSNRSTTPTSLAPSSDDANGNAPRIAVEHVKKIAGACKP